VSDAWIYTGDKELGGELCRLLAELGFSPRRVSANGSLLPPPDDGGEARRPALVVVAAGPAEHAPDALVARLCEHEELGEVPLVAALDAAHLDDARTTVAAAQELLVAPFAAGELKARVQRARLQVNGVQEGDVVRAGSLELNLATYQVGIAGAPVSFAYMEYELLKFLMTHPNRVFSREALLSAVWGYDYYGGARTVDVHIRRGRAKLGNEHATRIKTVRSVGYRFEL
jgi:two-component system, OmpR family, alkaline phosphatase synthesis response regulator PhoP